MLLRLHGKRCAPSVDMYDTYLYTYVTVSRCHIFVASFLWNSWKKAAPVLLSPESYHQESHGTGGSTATGNSGSTSGAIAASLVLWR